MGKAIKAALTAFVVVATSSFLITTIPFLSGTAAAGALAGNILGYAAASALFAFVSTGIGMLTQKGIDATSDNFGIKQTIKGSANPRQIVYGETVVGGTLGYVSTSGNDNHKLHMVIMLAGHEIQSLETLRVNGIDVTTASSTISGETVYRATNGDFVNTDNENAFTSGSLLRYTFHDGASNQSADGLAVANLSDFTTNHRFRGIAYVYIECIFDREAWSSFPQITAKIKGKKVYDPRDSSTAWSANPALCIRDYLMDTTNGVGATSDEINDANVAGSFYTAANTCDTDIAITGGTEDKYTLNGFFNTASEPQAVIEGMLSSCAGKIAYSNGKFNLFVGESQTASLTITDDDLLSAIDIQSNRGDSHNGVKAIYVDKDNNYQSGDMPPYQDSTFLSSDTPTGGASANFEKYMELQYPFTQSQFTAQRLGRIALKNSRQSMVISCLVNMGFYRLQVGDWVKVTNSRMSFTNKVFEVQAVGFEVTEDNFMATRLVLKENASSVFTFDTDNDYVAFAATGSTPTLGGAGTLPAPTSLSLTASSAYVVGTTAVLASWTRGASSNITDTEISYKITSEADSTYQIWTMVAHSSPQQRTTITGLTPNTGYTVRVRSYSFYNNTYSAYATGTVTTGGTVVGANDITNTNLSLTLSGTGLTLNNGGGSTQTFSNASVGLSNVTNHTQIKDDGSNAPTILKNDQISISQGSAGVLTLTRFSGSTDTTTITKTKLGLNYDDGATVGAIAGTNLKDSSNNTLGDVDIRNDDLDIDTSGTNVRIKKGTTVINQTGLSNSTVGLGNVANVDQTDAGNITSGTISINRTPTTVRNSTISIGSDGTLANAGGGQVTASGISAIQTSLGNAPDAIKNDNISISAGSSGVLTLTRYTGATDTTTITKSNLGLSYTDGATNNGTTINSSGNVSGAVTVASGGTIVAGNITIDGTNGRILITD